MSQPTEPTGDKLERALGLWSAVAVLVGSTIGSGIFRTPARIADHLPGAGPMLAVWVAGGVYALSGALTLAELGSAYPKTGGLFVIIREAYGRAAAFTFGWAQLVLIRPASLGAVSTTFAEYLLRLLGRDPAHPAIAPWVHYIAAGAVLVTAAVNYRGLRWGAIVQSGTTVAKFGGLALVVLAALAIGLPTTGGHFTPVAPAGSFAVAAFGAALVSVLWAFDGWADVSYVAGEVRDPQRNLPRALLIGTGAVTAIYLLANVGYLAVMPIDEIRRSPLVAAETAQMVLGDWAVVFVAATVMVSTFGTLNGTLLTSPRIFFAMADDRLLPRALAAVHPRYGTPHLAIGLCAALGVGFVLAQTFDQLIDAFVTAVVPFYALSIGAIFVVRGRPEYAPSYRMVGFPIVPIVFIAGSLFLLGTSIYDPESRWATLATLAVVVVGLPIYAIVFWRKR